VQPHQDHKMRTDLRSYETLKRNYRPMSAFGT
jgi:hypothetical protein